jgi:hypothetical protein
VTLARPLRHLIDDDDEETPTLVARFDVAAYARETADSIDLEIIIEGDDPVSGVRPSFPTLTREVGALPNEPEEDALVRRLGPSDRALRLLVPMGEVKDYTLDPQHGYLLSLLDGATTIAEIVDISSMPRLITLRILDELVVLGVAG